MRKRKRRAACLSAILAGVAALLLSSCADAISGRAGILKGAAAWRNQNWNEAILSFLPLSSSPDKAVSDFASYGLALAYIEQNELNAAMSRLSALDGTSSEKLLSAVWYERGVCEYLSGNYGEAAVCFRRSLEIEPSRADAKINLELSLMQAEGEGSFSDAQALAADAGQGVAESAVYSLIERKEVEQWKKSAQAARESPTPDY